MKILKEENKENDKITYIYQLELEKDFFKNVISHKLIEATMIRLSNGKSKQVSAHQLYSYFNTIVEKKIIDRINSVYQYKEKVIDGITHETKIELIHDGKSISLCYGTEYFFYSKKMEELTGNEVKKHIARMYKENKIESSKKSFNKNYKRRGYTYSDTFYTVL